MTGPLGPAPAAGHGSACSRRSARWPSWPGPDGWRAGAGLLSDQSTRAMGRLAVDVAFPALTFTQMLRAITPAALAQLARRSSWDCCCWWWRPAAAWMGGRLAGAGCLASDLRVPGGHAELDLPAAADRPGAARRGGRARGPGRQRRGPALALDRRCRHPARRPARRPRAARAGDQYRPLGHLRRCRRGARARGAAAWETAVSPAGSVVRALACWAASPCRCRSWSSAPSWRPCRAVPGPAGRPRCCSATRLGLAPAPTIVLVALLPLPVEVRHVGCLIAAMPVAVSCGMFIERFGGDADLGARAITLSTLLSIATVPALFGLVR